jgi:hypothetical protein
MAQLKRNGGVDKPARLNRAAGMLWTRAKTGRRPMDDQTKPQSATQSA